MKKVIVVFTLLLTTLVAVPQDAARILTGSAQPPLPFNILTQPGFENRTAGWSATGGTFSTTSSASDVARGRYAGAWTLPASTAAGLILQSDAITIPAGLYGRSCRVKILYKG